MLVVVVVVNFPIYADVRDFCDVIVRQKASSLMQAIEPWSGHYSGGSDNTLPVVWATAHVTQFAKLGWRYLKNGMGSGELYVCNLAACGCEAGAVSGMDRALVACLRCTDFGSRNVKSQG